MNRLTVIHKTKLTKEQTYFVNATELTSLLADCPNQDSICLNFSDDPSLFKSNYDRFVKKEGKLVVLSARYTPPNDETQTQEQTCVTVYAILKTIRQDLISQFESEHFETLASWVRQPRDAAWKQHSHAIQFLIDIQTEQVEVAHDIDFDSFRRHANKHRFRKDGRKIG